MLKKIQKNFTPKNITNLKWLILLTLIIVPRILWLGDMEFKADEKYGVELIAQAWNGPFNTLAPTSGHSGMNHPNGFFNLMALLSLGSSDPYLLGFLVAFLNVLALLVPLFLLRKNPPWLLFAFWAVHPTLVFGSRKIWPPDLIPAFLILALGLYWVYRKKIYAGFQQQAIGFFSAFSFGYAGQMYLAGAIQGWVPATFLLGYLYLQNRALFKPFFAGLFAAGLTYLPYVLAIATKSADAGEAHAHSELSFAALLGFFRQMFLAPSPHAFWHLYLRPIQDIEMANSFAGLYVITSIFCWIATLGMVGLWVYSFRHAKVRLAQLDERWIAAVFTVVMTGLALFAIRMGGHLHYWLGAVPVSLFGIAARVSEPRGPFKSALHEQRLSFWAWGTVIACVLAVFSVQYLVHVQGGLPGEYGPAFSTK